MRFRNCFWDFVVTNTDGVTIWKNVHTREYLGSDGREYLAGTRIFYWKMNNDQRILEDLTLCA